MKLVQRGAGLLLRLLGWQTVFVPPPQPKGIVLVYPHTSNWDFFVAVLYKLAVGFKVRWLGKHTLFRWPVRGILVRLGGIPVDRGDSAGFVDALLAEFATRESMWLGIAPEGTRGHTDHWKSGFYRIALAGGLCVGLGYLDYASRTVGVETYLKLTGDPTQDFACLRAAYAGKRGRRPQNAGTIRLRE